ncbi:MAG: fibronectin type III domain-containing protein [Flavobacteriales bacterium]|nr:fibronectin type III domain-containing protein [Flavobacteriales bacterium]MCB9194514.1 fibronectin type III domain-containing protein [Flavobacteriales bacterium]
MNKVKTGLRGLNPRQKAVRARIVRTRLTGNPHFPDPQPSLMELTKAIDRLQAANLAALDRGRLAIMERNAAEKAMNDMLTRMAAYVNSAALGDPLKLASSGFLLAKRPRPISSLREPRQIKARPTPFPGQVEIRWEGVRGALVYEVERAVGAFGPDRRWVRIAVTSKPRLLVEDLGSNEQHTFRVYAIGTRTYSPYSQEASSKAA